MGRTSRTWLLVTIALAFGLAAGQSVRADDEPVSADQQKCSLIVRNRPLREVVRKLLAGTGVRARFKKNVPNVRVTVEFGDVTIQQGLRCIVRAARQPVPNLTLSKDGDDFTISIRKAVRCFPLPEFEPPKDVPAGGEGSLR